MSTLESAATRYTTPATTGSGSRRSGKSGWFRKSGKSRMDPTRNNTAAGAAAWVLALLFAAPVLWMILTSFHSEIDAATNPPSDIHGSSEFRRKLARHFARQAIAVAAERAGGSR